MFYKSTIQFIFVTSDSTSCRLLNVFTCAFSSTFPGVWGLQQAVAGRFQARAHPAACVQRAVGALHPPGQQDSSRRVRTTYQQDACAVCHHPIRLPKLFFFFLSLRIIVKASVEKKDLIFSIRVCRRKRRFETWIVQCARLLGFYSNGKYWSCNEAQNVHQYWYSIPDGKKDFRELIDLLGLL